MGKCIELTAKDFKKTIAEGVVLVEFWAPWAGPCRMIKPIIDDIVEDYDGMAKICKINTDIEQDIVIKYGIRSIPTIMFFKNGEMVDQTVGAQSKKAFTEKLDKYLEN